MIKNPAALVVVLLAIETLVLYLSNHRRFSRWFSIIPPVFWIYFLPMLASTFGLIDSQSPVYGKITNWLLPMSLFILLVTVDIHAILRLGPRALAMFFAGSVGIGLGTCAAFWAFKPLVGAEFWSGFAALSASWTGGSANMIAVKEALAVPDAVFLPMVIVDTIVPYVWMGLLVLAAGHQQAFDRVIRADRRGLDSLDAVAAQTAPARRESSVFTTAGILALAAVGGCAALAAAPHLPVVKNVVSTYAWTIILASTLAITLSFTPVRGIERYGSSRIGYFLLYFVLTTIGAKASIGNLGSSLVLIAAGFCIIAVHAVVLLAAARVLRAPLSLAAAASQANVGGAASAPVVAEIYHKGFASTGLLLAILGNILGTYFGILIGHICRP